MKLLVKRLLLALCGVLVLLLALEGALRIAASLTRVHFDPAHPQEAMRILCVGDSNTYGLHHNPELQSYPAVLRQRLRKLNTQGFQVENRGVPGWATRQMRSELPGFLAELQPHIVFVLGGINNTWNVTGDSSGDHWMSHLRLVRLVRVLLARWRGTESFRLEQRDGNRLEVHDRHGTRSVQGEHGTASVDAVALAQSTREDLRTMVAMVRTSGATPVLMTYASEAEPPFVTVNDVAREVSRELDVALVDHGAAFRSHFAKQGGYDALMHASDHHPNARGYALMVDGILARFLELHWIERMPPALEPPAPRVDQYIELSSEAPATLRLTAPVGFIFDIQASTHTEPPMPVAAGLTLPIGFDEALSLKANDVPQLRGRVAQSETLITIPRELLVAPEVYAVALLADDDAVVRAISTRVTIKR